MQDNPQAIFISWQFHRRTESLAARLEIPLFSFVSKQSRFLKHPLFILKTIGTLAKLRPKTLFVQNPSAFLAIVAIVLKPIFKYKLIVDAHNIGVYAYEDRHKKFDFVFPFFHKHADITIVTNSILASIVENNGGTSFILPDPLPRFSLPSIKEINHRDDNFEVTFICTYAPDEPFNAVFEAATKIPPDILINVTGNHQKLTPNEKARIPQNVRLTGFLPEEDFLELLMTSSVIMDLTTRPDCLVCGAYEAVALEKGMILSKTPALREYFKGAVFVDNTADSLAAGILKARERSEELRQEVKEFKKEIETKWENQFDALKNIAFPPP